MTKARIPIVEDNTAIAQSVKVLREAEARYRKLLESLPALTYSVALGPPVTLLYISPQAEAMLGFPLAEWKANPQRWIAQIHPEDRPRVLTQ